jgi:hypothetical protein
MGYGELHAEQDDSGMQEYLAHEEMARNQAIAEVQSFIDSGSITKQQACDMLTEENNVRSTQ